MPQIKSLISYIEKLSSQEQDQLMCYLEEILTLDKRADQITEEVMESRFSRGKICPHCNSNTISKNGKYNGKQRYICKSCGKTFNDFTHSAIYMSKKPLDKWLEYAKCMINGYSIRKCAEIVGINIATSFFWRHKLLDAIRLFIGIGSVKGIVEADEIFLTESFKGNHKNSKNFKLPRNAHKRGEDLKNKGISKDHICVATAMDRQGNIIMELLCKGKMTHQELKRLYTGRITNNSILCTDSDKRYNHFAIDLSLGYKPIKGGYHKEGIYHIQHISSLRSKFKKWIYKFHGVATKYLNNYIYWFKWLQYYKNDKDIVKIKNLIVQSNVVYCDVKTADYKTRKPSFI
ncbi:transposase [Clostridium polyendosporum]|uniref:Transposase n=1 Tax=Clostridium polyendosporum TaxID=69208 RepID=A0A919RZB5_9CLOT|nr:IS1595 family transposase [Clostridium polyendosporum]GIM28564.1 transposase [Clostridium polyendosporum]